MHKCIHTHLVKSILLQILTFPFLPTLIYYNAAVKCTEMLDTCMDINSVYVGGRGSVCLSLPVKRWGRLVLNRDGYWQSISMSENIFRKCSESMKGTPLDVWTWPVQTNAGHQHSITESFHAAVKGGRHLVMWQADSYIFGPWISTSLNFDTVTELQ